MNSKQPSKLPDTIDLPPQAPIAACTGITLKSKDGTTIVARTIEWGGSNLNSQYVVVPRGYTERSYTPNGVDGMTFTARYGYVGLAVEQKEFIAEGLNEVGLSVNMRNIMPQFGIKVSLICN